VLKPWRWVRTFFGSSTRGATATGLAAGLLATATLVTTGLATALGAVFGAVLEAATFEAVAFEPVAFAAVFAVLFGIALLLFFEGFAAEARSEERRVGKECRSRW